MNERQKTAAFGPWVEAPASAQQEALEGTITLEQAESHAHICGKLAEEHKSDPVLFAALTDAAAIIRDLLRDRLSASAAGALQRRPDDVPLWASLEPGGWP